MHKVKHKGFAARATKLAAAARSLKRQSGVSTPFSLAFLTDQTRAPQPELIAQVLPQGSAVILRDYEFGGRAALAAQLKSICSARGILLLIGADPNLAEEIGADGVHFPGWYEGPRKAAPGFITTASCHSADDLRNAGAKDIDVVLLSPVFPTASHRGAPALGVNAFQMLAASSPAPVLALGGIAEGNAHQLAGDNVVGIAAIDAFLR